MGIVLNWTQQGEDDFLGTMDMRTEFRRIYMDGTYRYQAAPMPVYVDKVCLNRTGGANYGLG